MVTSTAPAKHLFTVEEYHRMGEVGIIVPSARVELIAGEVIDMAPIGPHHASSGSFLTWIFATRLGERAFIWPQVPILLDTHSESLPDLALLRWRADFYVNALPRPADVLLLIEVSDSTVRFDRQVKLPLYAQAGIPEFWLVNLPRRQVEVYRYPVDGAWRESFVVRGDEVVSPVAFPDLSLAAHQILVEPV